MLEPRYDSTAASSEYMFHDADEGLVSLHQGIA